MSVISSIKNKIKSKSIEETAMILEKAGVFEKKEEVVTIKCPKCNAVLDKKRVKRRKFVCYNCRNHFRISTSNRINMVIDEGTFKPWFEDIADSNPLNTESYLEKLEATRKKIGVKEAVTVGTGKILGEDVVLGVCDSRFLMGSMGYVVGEKITRAIEKATELKLPVFIFCCSGGARMQEGIISLMQMAKTSAAIKRHSEAGLFYSTILTDPTTGGVTASFAMLGDVVIAEPGALIGFAGPRVIKQTIGQDLPKGFQTAEFLVEHGMIDGIVERKNLKKTLYFLIISHKSHKNFTNFNPDTEYKYQISELVKEKAFYSEPKTPWQKVKATRRADRPSALDYIDRVFDVFVEAHGDRNYRDDKAMVGGLAFIDGQPVTVIGEEKGRNIFDSRDRNFGMPMPEGYRKALRLMKQAEKFNRPIISFINTPGAFCGIEAEERGQGEAIARNLMEMSNLKVPVLCVLIGEGGSGGALAIAVGNQVWMMENATYSILSPEGYATILWKDSGRSEEASEIMKITAEDLKELNIIEKIIPEFGGANKETLDDIAGVMKENIIEFLKSFDNMTGEEIANQRYERFRKL